MVDRPDPHDLELLRAARDAVAEAVRDVDVEGDLADVRARIAAGGSGGGTATIRPIGADRDRPGWPAWAAAAAVVAVVAGGAIVLMRGDDPDTVRTESPTSLIPVTTAPPEPEPAVVTTVPVPATTGVDDDPPPPTTAGEPAPTTTVVPPEPDPALAIGVQCVEESSCTRLAAAADGRIVAYDPVDETLTVLDASGSTVDAVVPLAEPLHDWVTDPADIERVMPFIEAVGPDDIVYLTAWLGGGDGERDLLAIPLGGSNAGTVIGSWEGAGGVGDSDLVPTLDGLAVVGCCGNDTERPAPDDATIGWVHDGAADAYGGPVFRLTLGDAGNDLVRVGGGLAQRFRLPTVASNPRGMPQVVATDDGGALMAVLHSATDHSYLVRFRTDWPEFGIDNADVFYVERPSEIALLEPAGTVVVRDGDRFVRRAPAEVGTPGWTGRIDRATDGDFWTVTAPGLNEHIDATSPAWAADPHALAVQLVAQVDPNETFSSTFDEATGVLTLTLEDLLDDSVFGLQYRFELGLGDDGLYRVSEGTRAQRCQPGRGQQDYLPAPCV